MNMLNPRTVWGTLLVGGVLTLSSCAAPAAAPAAGSEAAPSSDIPAAEAPAAAESGDDPEMPASNPEDSVESPTTGTTIPANVGLSARQLLAQQLRIDYNAVTVIEAEAVEWTDGCLGVTVVGQMCAQVITPGYRVTLAVQDQQYVYHTDATGDSVQLAAAPEVQLKDVVLLWQREKVGQCHSASIGAQTVASGACEGVKLTTPLITELERSTQLADFVATYAGFEGETAAGSVSLNGQGETTATPAEQRMIAEWAQLVAQEAEGGRGGASWGLVLVWHREGGIAGFCDDVTIDVTGQVSVSSCWGNQPQDLGQRRLTAAELAQLYAWTDTLQSFEGGQKDQATADAMQIELVFSGAGRRSVTAEEQQAIQDFAAGLALEFAQR